MTLIARVGIIVLSDKAFHGHRKDMSGPLLRDLVRRRGWKTEKLEVIPDQAERLVDLLVDYSDRLGLDLIVTSGGTGPALRDVTPEATGRVLEKELPGIAEILRVKGYETKPTAVLSRGRSGIRGKTLIVNLPGSPAAVAEGWEIVAEALSHARELIRGAVSECGCPRPGNIPVE